MYEQAQPAGGVDSIVGDEARQAAAAIIRESPDAFALYNAMSGLGTDEDAVWSVLETREDSIPSLYQEYGALMSRLKYGFFGSITLNCYSSIPGCGC